MCCCEKPTVNGQPGYRWNNPNGLPSVRPANPPALLEGDILLFDEPGRCGGIDSHSHHYRVVRHSATLWLLVRHGGGDERIRLSNTTAMFDALTSLDSTSRYWVLGAVFHAHNDSAYNAELKERSRWYEAAAQKRIKTRKVRGTPHVKVWIEPNTVERA